MAREKKERIRKPGRRLAVILLAFVLSIAMMPLAVFADSAGTDTGSGSEKVFGDEDRARASGNVYILGREINGKLQDTVPHSGSIFYDSESKTLALNNAVIDLDNFKIDDPTGNVVAGIYATSDLRIVIMGQNTIKSTNNNYRQGTEYVCGIEGWENIEIAEGSDGASLSVELAQSNSGNSAINFTGINADESIIANAATVNVEMGEYGKCAGIYAWKSLYLNNAANVSVTASGSDNTAVSGTNNIGNSKIAGSSILEMHSDGVAFNCWTPGKSLKEIKCSVSGSKDGTQAEAWDKTSSLRDYKYVKFEGSEDSSAGGRFGKDVRVLGRKITEDNCDDVLADIQPGAVKYDMENKILHLYNADLDFADFHHEYDDDENPDSGTNMIIGIDADDDITIDLNGRNRIFTTKDTFDAKKEYVYGLSSGMMNNMTITGEGSLEIAFDKTNEKLNYTGIDAGKGLTINGAAVTVDLGGELAGDGIDCMMCDLEVKNGAVFRISCDGEKSTAADYRMANGMRLDEDAGFELVSDGTAINCYFVSEAVKERGALVNEEPTAEGASAWDKTTFLRKYKYVRFPQEHNHKHQLTQYDAKAATCTEPGNIEYWVCWKCGKYFSDSEGTTEIDPDEIFTQRLEHKWSDWNPIDETKHQRRCAYDTKGTHIQIEDHEWDGGKVIKRATLFNKGVIEYSCDVCGAKKTEEFSLKDVVKDTVAKVVEKIRKWIEKIINGGNDSLSGSKPAYNSKAPNPISASGKTVIVKYKKLKTKDWTFKALSIMKVRKAKGKVSYKLISVSKKKYRKHFSVNEVTGKVKIKKKLRRGSYVLTVRVSAAGNAFYKAGSVKVKFRIKVQ